MIGRFLIALIIAAFGATTAHAQCSTGFSKAALNTQVLQDFPNQLQGFITPLTMQTFLPNLIESFQQYPGVNTQLNTTYTVALSDYGQLVTFNNASPVAVTLLAASTTGFCPFSFYAINFGAGTVTITPQSGTISGAANLVIPQNSSYMVFSDGTNWQALKFGTTGSGSGTVASGTINSLGYYAASGQTINGLASCASGVYVTDGGNVPSCARTLPAGLTASNMDLTGTVMAPDAGTWSSGGITTLSLSTTGTITFGVLSPVSLGASPTTVTGLATNNSPDVSNDYIPYFSAGTGSIEKATVGSIAAAATAGVSNLNGLTGNLNAVNAGGVSVSPTGTSLLLQVAVTPPQGRLTLQTGVPVMNTTQANKATLYYDCFHGGNSVPYWNGTADTLDAIAGCEVSTAMQSSSTGVLNTAGVFDVWWEGNTHHNICIATNGSGGGWASDSGSNTARGTGYSQLDFTSRPYITNKNTIADCYNGATNYGGSLTANKLTYLGTIFTTAAGQTTYQFGASGVAAVLDVWNAYNRVAVGGGTPWPSTASWIYSNGTFRQANSSAVAQVSYVFGLNEEDVTALVGTALSAIGTASCTSGIGIDSTTVASGTSSLGGLGAATSSSFDLTTAARYNGYPGVGHHVIAGLESGNGIVNGCTWNGGISGSVSVQLRM